jgi:uncharacterized cupin superfamily protein
MSDFITVLRETCPTPVVDATKWKRIGGDPHTVNLNAYLSADGSKIMGTWICTPGKFEVNYENGSSATSSMATASSPRKAKSPST